MWWNGPGNPAVHLTVTVAAGSSIRVLIRFLRNPAQRFLTFSAKIFMWACCWEVLSCFQTTLRSSDHLHSPERQQWRPQSVPHWPGTGHHLHRSCVWSGGPQLLFAGGSVRGRSGVSAARQEQAAQLRLEGLNIYIEHKYGCINVLRGLLVVRSSKIMQHDNMLHDK